VEKAEVCPLGVLDERGMSDEDGIYD
jgi:hypothetical protein